LYFESNIVSIAQQPVVVQGFLTIEVELHGRVISPRQKPLLDNTQHSHETDIHASGGIRKRRPNRRKAADRRLRQRPLR